MQNRPMMWLTAMSLIALPLLASTPALAQQADPRLVGRWASKTQELEIMLQLRADGTYNFDLVQITPTGRNASSVAGQYVVTGQTLELKTTAEPIRVRFCLVSDDQLDLTDVNGKPHHLAREKGAEAPGAGQAGPAQPGGSPGAAAPAEPQAAVTVQTHAHPGGRYTVAYPSSWSEKPCNEGPDCFAIVSPSGKAELWIRNAPAAGGTAQGYYDTVFEKPLRTAFADGLTIDPVQRTNEREMEWLAGRANVAGQFATVCLVTEAAGQFFGLILIARPGLTDAEMAQANGIARAFTPVVVPETGAGAQGGGGGAM